MNVVKEFIKMKNNLLTFVCLKCANTSRETRMQMYKCIKCGEESIGDSQKKICYTCAMHEKICRECGSKL